jgi:hypothetical protein
MKFISPEDQPHSSRRLNEIVSRLQASSYLEIGVFKGSTIERVSCDDRTGVDPSFAFDTQHKNFAGVNLCETTSDKFFSELDVSKKFDVFFIDGLHEFEQTYRDFASALFHAHDRSVFLIDDTFPTDVWSSLRNQQRSLKMRRLGGSKINVWHGDTFKSIFAIHDFHLGYKYKTIMGAGNPQTLVWKSKNDWRTPQFDNWEAISRLEYFDLVDHREIMRSASEEEAINECCAELMS